MSDRVSAEDGTVWDATPDNARSVWRAEVYENGLDSPAETGEGATPDAALADLYAKLKTQARERVAAIEAAAAEGTTPPPSDEWQDDDRPCPKCGGAVKYRVQGDHDDEQYRCQDTACKRSWWVDGCDS